MTSVAELGRVPNHKNRQSRQDPIFGSLPTSAKNIGLHIIQKGVETNARLGESSDSAQKTVQIRWICTA